MDVQDTREDDFFTEFISRARNSQNLCSFDGEAIVVIDWEYIALLICRKVKMKSVAFGQSKSSFTELNELLIEIGYYSMKEMMKSIGLSILSKLCIYVDNFSNRIISTNWAWILEMETP